MHTVRKLWENSNISEKYESLADSARFDEPLSAHTSFKTGGPCDIFLEPESIDEVCFAYEFFVSRDIPVSLLGGGTNLLVSDTGIRGAVLGMRKFNRIERRPETADRERVLVSCGAGVSMDDLGEWCAQNGVSGLERFAGLPGTVGGAAFMNARCYDLSISDVFYSAQTLYFSGKGCTMVERGFEPSAWDYKKSSFQARNGADSLILSEGSTLILSVVFALGNGSEADIRQTMATYVSDRTGKGHYRYPSAGSMFKNNRAFGKPSGQIIDEAGLKGFRIGDAQVAPWHGNIVINAGRATSADLRSLVQEVQRRVLEKTGFALEPEVLFTGEWSVV